MCWLELAEQEKQWTEEPTTYFEESHYDSWRTQIEQPPVNRHRA